MYARILPSPRRCSICCEILDPFGIVRLEGGGYISEYELAFPDMAWDLGYLIHLCFHQHPIKPTKAEWTLKVKGETVLDHVVFWFGCADRQVKARRSPSSLWDLAGKALLTPIRKEAEWLEGRGYISEYELAFPEMAWDMGYLTYLCFHPHLIKPRMDFKGETAP